MIGNAEFHIFVCQIKQTAYQKVKKDSPLGARYHIRIVYRNHIIAEYPIRSATDIRVCCR